MALLVLVFVLLCQSLLLFVAAAVCAGVVCVLLFVLSLCQSLL